MGSTCTGRKRFRNACFPVIKSGTNHMPEKFKAVGRKTRRPALAIVDDPPAPVLSRRVGIASVSDSQ